jgi:hypothetical protein
MKSLTLAALSALTFLTPAFDAFANPLDEYLWEKRLIVVFADSDEDPRFVRQLELLAEEKAMLDDRDVVIITDTTLSPMSEVRKKLRPRDFQIALVDKEGRVALRKSRPWTVRELSRVIDKMPLRQQEIRHRRQ